MSTRYNLTGSSQSLIFCVALHWDDHGDHPNGTYDDCTGNSTDIPEGGAIHYDEDAPNGSFITSLLDAKGFS